MDLIPEEFRELGRESLRPYIVAFRPAMRGWPERFNNELEYARQRYTAGTHFMCQGREGDIIIQYLIPRTGKPKPQKWFDKSWFAARKEMGLTAEADEAA